MTAPTTADRPWLDTEAPLEARVESLLSAMTLAEKCEQMLHEAPAIDRLGVPAYNWWNECLHGVARAGRATVFPQAINLGATFDTDLIGRIAHAIALEGRAKHHAANAAGNRGQYRGLTFWTPNINIFRDPRWGRGHETYGEDPHLTARIGVAFVKALQGDHARYLQAAACAKHYAVHSGPEKDRHRFNAQPTLKDLHETYLPAFEALVREADVETVMGAYNRTLDHPCCAHPYLIGEILRERWGFQGHVVSDCWAIRDFHEHHKITRDCKESAALAVKHGCDLNCGLCFGRLADAVEEGLLDEADIDRSVRRLLRTRLRLGMFDPPQQVPMAETPLSVVNCSEHVELAREAAARSIVLLKNDGVLPLDTSPKRIWLCGPSMADLMVLLANYYGASGRLVTCLEGITEAAGEAITTEYRPGIWFDHPNANPIDWTTGESRKSDITIVALGLSPMDEGEEGEAIASRDVGDRRDTRLPEHQLEFVRKLRRAADEAGRKLVLLVTGGSAISSPELHDLADALLWVGYSGEQGGRAVADVLFGAVNPAGRLPMTWYRDIDDIPAFEDYHMYPAEQGGAGNGRTYRYFTGEPLYPFGFGLSYTAFRYDGIKLSHAELPSDAEGSATVEVSLTNVGERDGDEVVQLYVRAEDAPFPTPKLALCGFRRVHVPAGGSTTVRFDVRPMDLAVVDGQGERHVSAGRYTLFAGGSQPDARSRGLGAPATVQTELRITD